MTDAPNPYPAAARCLGELRHGDEHGEHPETEQQRRQVRAPHGRDTHHAHVDQGGARAATRTRSTARAAPPLPRRARARSRCANPTWARRTPPSRPVDEPARHQDRAEPVDTPARPYRRLGNEDEGRHSGTDRHHQGEPEQPVVGQVFQDRSGQQDASADAQPEDGRQHADGTGHPFMGELVTDDAEGEREDGARPRLG